MKMKPNFFCEAVSLLAGACMYDAQGTTIKVWKSPDLEQPSQSDIDAKIVELEAEWDALAWKRSREENYPSIPELTVALYDTDDKSAVEAKRAAVKLKYPKP